MKDAASQTIYLEDYKPPAFLVDDVHLTFQLDPRKTRVISRISFRPNPQSGERKFTLHGEALTLISAKIDGKDCNVSVENGILTAAAPNKPFVWEAEVEISPQTNTALEGLYMSNGMYSTQCEAEGFRKITYYPDRPDVMSRFHVRIEDRSGNVPVLLSNGNPVASGDGWAEWHDPWPKPAYLFALVAGDLVNHPGQFTTASGRDVTLNIWVRPGDEDKCSFAMQALIASMRWDEEVYGREYDLDLFNIVAVDDFNMGAMENKGLNIFNSSCVLANPATSTDADFENIEAIIAHEYFHNWTGNRITCRDWFQLCLKEGLTVFRDAQFTSDMRSAPVKRIKDANGLRNYQFPEDNGPLAHPVRPDSFVEINNFYTATVYEKGAEVIGMLKRLVGDAAYSKALDLYFERHDGDAATIEDWLKVFKDSTGRDLSQFKRWYEQAGTPRVKVTDSYADGTYQLHFSQSTPPTPGQPNKAPQVIPIAVGLLNANGDEIHPTTVLELTEAEQSFEFEGLASKPIASVLREFSAPVYLEQNTDEAQRTFLLAHDTDPFNRWEAGNALMQSCLQRMAQDSTPPDTSLLDGLLAVFRDETLDPAFRALTLKVPQEEEIARAIHAAGAHPDPDAIYRARETFLQALSQHFQDVLPRIYAQHQVSSAYRPDAAQSGARALSNAALSLLCRLDGGKAAAAQFTTADNMTQKIAALGSLLRSGHGENALEEFYQQWKSERLVVDKWFAIQIACAAPEAAVSLAEQLTTHPDFTIKNPNRFRSVFRPLAGNFAAFHQISGEGYQMMTDWIIKLDQINPQLAARFCTVFETLGQFDPQRQSLIRNNLQRLLDSKGLSRDSTEMANRMLDR